MTKNDEKLTKLRGEIDAIDDTIQDLLAKRTMVVESVRDLKKGQPVKIRPAREAEILYRLMDRHESSFPKRELARIWREIIVATLRFEGPFSVAVYMTDEVPGYWDLARDQYGSFTPMTRHGSARRVVEAVRTQEATLGILPLPQRDESENWWRFLVSESPKTPRIIARLPFIGEGNARDPGVEALVICPVVQEETGRDRSYIAVEAEDDIGFAAIEAALSQTGHSPAFHQVWHDPDRPPGWTYLVEIFGFIPEGGRRWARFIDGLGSRAVRVIHLGGYATSLTDNELISGASSGDGD